MLIFIKKPCFRLYLMMAILVLVLTTGCESGSGSESVADPIRDLGLTQTVISIQQTQTAMAIGDTGGDAPATAPPAEATVPPPSATEPPVVPATEPPPPSPEPTSGTTFEEWMKVANILVYEDIIYHQHLPRYIKNTLQDMDLNVTYVGSAIGEFKKKLLLEAPPGGWDLIIAGAEAKRAPILKGEYFDYLYNALEAGTPVILEMYYLDEVSEGSMEKILEKCGIEFEKDWGDISSVNQIMWPLAPEDPILNNPNSNLTFTSTSGTWALKYDIGDLVKIGYGGDARLLVGISSYTDQMHGTLTKCMGDHLILQTFSSHQLEEDVSLALWENYIYNALKVRYAETIR